MEAASSEDENDNSPSSKSASPPPSKSSSSNCKKSDRGVNIESIQQPEKVSLISMASTSYPVRIHRQFQPSTVTTIR
ncbi:unnamed protein product [Anisakis simplex]|uniref:Uncharacterized protein n=1 Tax=Anisakis simplex TaxID=6269 RepID=A0A0M3J9C4_ANISI|nr:unnamed protein product [Anisakis simplex]